MHPCNIFRLFPVNFQCLILFFCSAMFRIKNSFFLAYELKLLFSNKSSSFHSSKKSKYLISYISINLVIYLDDERQKSSCMLVVTEQAFQLSTILEWMQQTKQYIYIHATYVNQSNNLTSCDMHLLRISFIFFFFGQANSIGQ